MSLCRFLRVILGLRVPQLIVFSGGVGQQALVGALLDDLAVVKDGDLIAELAGGQPVADVDGRFVPRDLVELGVDLRLGHGVERGGGFIQDDEGRILVQSPRDGDLLRLSAGDGHAVLVQLLIQRRVQPLRHRRQPVAEARLLQAIGHAGGIVSGAGRDILAQREGQQPEILKDDREDVHVLVVAVLPDVDPVQQDDCRTGGRAA